MARLFDDAASDHLSSALAAVTATPLTLACWFYSDSSTVNQTLMSVADTGTSNNYFELVIEGAVGGDPIRARAAAGSAGAAASTNNYPTNTWAHGAATFTSATSRQVWLNGSGSTANTTSQTPAGLDAMSVGRRHGSSPVNYMSGRIEHAAIWNVVLSANHILMLAKGISPMRVQPANLLCYWPCMRAGTVEPNIAKGQITADYGMSTISGTTQADGSRVVLGWSGTQPPYYVQPATSVPVFYHQRQQQGMAA